MDRQYKDQKKHGQTIQRPKETWTDNTTTKRNMDRQFVCPCFFSSLYGLSMFLLVVVLSVFASFGRCIVCPCFFWSLYCLSKYKDQKKHGQAKQRPKGNMDRQYNDQKKQGQEIQRPKETWTENTTTKRYMDFCLLVIVLSVLLSFGHCIVCPSVFWSLYCLPFCLLVIVLSNDQKTEGQTIQ
jgi:hypothetical protein